MNISIAYQEYKACPLLRNIFSTFSEELALLELLRQDQRAGDWVTKFVRMVPSL